MSDCMTFPDDWREFLKNYSFRDSEEVYTNGSELIPVFRVEQLIEHLLAKQEPRVLTLEELRTYPKEKFLVWLERTYAEGAETGLVPCEITGVGTKGISHYFGSNDFASYNHKCYGWRCWTSRPTDEQREAVKWD